jgi:hypothetical protein
MEQHEPYALTRASTIGHGENLTVEAGVRQGHSPKDVELCRKDSTDNRFDSFVQPQGNRACPKDNRAALVLDRRFVAAALKSG